MHRIYVKIVILFLLLTSLVSCGSIFFPEFEVRSIDLKKDYISIIFSHEPERSSVIGAFSFTRDSEPIDGKFSFSDSKMYFYPNIQIVDGYDYSLTLTTEAESVDGISLIENYTYKEHKKLDRTLPTIVSITPKNETVCEAPLEEVKIEFSKDIKPVTLQNSLSITPAEEFRIIWDNSRNVRILFNNNLQLSTRYTIKIEKTLTDTESNFLAEPFVSTFLNGSDFSEPKYSIFAKNDKDNYNKVIAQDVLTEDVHSDSYFVIEFNKEVDMSTVNANFSIDPPINYTLEFDEQTKKSATVKLNELPEWDKLYRLVFKAGIKDFCNNEIKENMEYRIKFNSEKYRPVSFIIGNLRKKDTEPYPLSNKKSLPFRFAKDNDYGEFVVDESFYPPSENGAVKPLPVVIDCLFSVSRETKSIDIMTVFGNIQFSGIVSIDNVNKIIPIPDKEIKELYKSEANVSTILVNGGKVVGIRLFGNMGKPNGRGMFLITISDEIMDNNKNKLGESINLSYNKL